MPKFSKHLHPESLSYRIQPPLNHNPAKEKVSEKPLRIAVIGFGPKGLYALERILSESKASGKAVDVTCFNANPFWGMGPNYNPHQPSYLLLNYPIRMVNAFSEDEHQLLQDRPTLAEFYNRVSHAEEAKGYEWCSRSLVGYYLNWVLNELLSQRPKSSEIHFEQKHISEVQKDKDKYIIDNQIYDAVIITTGHAYAFEYPYPEHHNYIHHIYPIEQVENVGGNTVGVLGLGLTFVDAVLGLTEGRGGKFTDDFSYVPSGREPKKIVAFSGSGQMMIPRSTEILPPLTFNYFTDEVVSELKLKHGQIDWEQNILPLLAKEYETIGRQYNVQNISFNEIAHLPLTVGEQLEAFFSEPELFNAWSAVWRQLAPKISELYAFRGFTPKSQKFFDSKYFGIFNRMSYGLPDYNARKIYALYQSGILNFDFAKGSKLELQNQGWQLSNESDFITLDALINARIPKAKDQKLPLFESLINNGIAEWAKHGQYAYHTLEINREGCIPNEKILLQGTPTEHFVLDNESLSRNCHNFSSSFIRKLFIA